MLTDKRIYELWREANDVDPDQMRSSIAFARLVEQEAARQERERAQALTNAAEQFVAWQGEDNQGGMLDYFEDIFSEAIRSRSSP